jgi:hypothetical protein
MVAWIYLVPASSENIATSLDRALPVERLTGYLSKADIGEIQARGGAEGIRCWAMTLGKRSEFDRMEPGDEVLFSESGTGLVTRYAQVTYKVENKALGDSLWPYVPGNPWEFIYFLRNVQTIRVPKSKVVVALTYSPTFEIAGATRVRADRLAQFTAQHGTMAKWLGVAPVPGEPAPEEPAPEESPDLDFGQAPNDDPAARQTYARRVRRGQPKFRQNLLRCFNGQCVVTRTNVDAVLEASHIDPHSTSGLNHTDNGLLLRSDIHALFDDDLLRIDPDTLSVVVDASLKDTIYWDLNGRQLFSRTSITEQRYALLRARWQRREPGPVEI